VNSVQFVQIIRHALPGCWIEQLQIKQQVCRVRWGGQVFDISGGMLDGWPLFLVTTPTYTLNDATGKVLEMLDSMSEEFASEPKPWADTDELIRRLRELQEEEDDHDPA
tara:strand:+ start:2716 stop:3042 length:327 start_codon:yes stop_codon:yes gene_type:complete